MVAVLSTILTFALLGFVVSALAAVLGRNDMEKRRRWNTRMLISLGVAVAVVAVFGFFVVGLS